MGTRHWRSRYKSHFLKKKLICYLHFQLEVVLPMYRQYIANSKKCYVMKVSLVEQHFFLANTRHSPL